MCCAPRKGWTSTGGTRSRDAVCGAVLGSQRFRAVTHEQARAFAKPPRPEGLALIDGQAGTGKSYTMARDPRGL